MIDVINLDEFKIKFSDLESEIRNSIDKPVRCYFYIQNEDKITVLIFEPALTTHRVFIMSDAQCVADSVPNIILQKITKWLDNLSVVRRRQIERTRLFKYELIKKVWSSI